MGAAIVIVVAFIEAAALAAGLYVIFSRGSASKGEAGEKLNTELQSRRELSDELKKCIAEMVDAGEVRSIIGELIAAQEALRAERGRITITQAELDSVEGRLRELEEIERELEASSIETQEELKILQKKEKELRSKNEALQAQIAGSVQQLEKLMTEIEMSAQMQEQVFAMKAELLSTEQQIATLLLQIEQGNEQYFVMKKRYDALDIEYAQLYERFSETEAATAKPAS